MPFKTGTLIYELRILQESGQTFPFWSCFQHSEMVRHLFWPGVRLLILFYVQIVWYCWVEGQYSWQIKFHPFSSTFWYWWTETWSVSIQNRNLDQGNLWVLSSWWRIISQMSETAKKLFFVTQVSRHIPLSRLNSKALLCGSSFCFMALSDLVLEFLADDLIHLVCQNLNRDF